MIRNGQIEYRVLTDIVKLDSSTFKDHILIFQGPHPNLYKIFLLEWHRNYIYKFWYVLKNDYISRCMLDSQEVNIMLTKKIQAFFNAFSLKLINFKGFKTLNSQNVNSGTFKVFKDLSEPCKYFPNTTVNYNNFICKGQKKLKGSFSSPPSP